MFFNTFEFEGAPVKHNQKFLSSEKIDFLSVEIYSEDNEGNVKVKTHGKYTCIYIHSFVFFIFKIYLRLYDDHSMDVLSFNWYSYSSILQIFVSRYQN